MCVCVCVCVCACVNGSFYPDVLSRHTTKIITTITETCKLTLISFLFLNDDTLLVTVDNLSVILGLVWTVKVYKGGWARENWLHCTWQYFSHPVAELHIMIKIHKEKIDTRGGRLDRNPLTKKKKDIISLNTSHVITHVPTCLHCNMLDEQIRQTGGEKKEVGNYLNCRDHIIKYPLFESLTLKFSHMIMMMMMMMVMMKSWMPRTQTLF